jgi:hypothetical protein
MHTVKTIAEMMDNNEDLFVIRAAIVELISYYTQRGREAKNTSALPHLINAMGSLTLYGYAPRQPIKIGFFTCLIDLEKAIVAINENRDAEPLRINTTDVVTYDFLIDALQPLRNESSSYMTNDNHFKTGELILSAA